MTEAMIFLTDLLLIVYCSR